MCERACSHRHGHSPHVCKLTQKETTLRIFAALSKSQFSPSIHPFTKTFGLEILSILPCSAGCQVQQLSIIVGLECYCGHCKQTLLPRATRTPPTPPNTHTGQHIHKLTTHAKLGEQGKTRGWLLCSKELTELGIQKNNVITGLYVMVEPYLA